MYLLCCYICSYGYQWRLFKYEESKSFSNDDVEFSSSDKIFADPSNYFVALLVSKSNEASLLIKVDAIVSVFQK